jgi:hypothetical protein
MSQVPAVDYRFGDIWKITDFVTPQNPMVQWNAMAIMKTAANKDDFIYKVAQFINQAFRYPTNMFGQPATQCQLSNAEFFPFVPHFQSSIFRAYAWDFPAETLIIKLGYCAETSNLMVSMLKTQQIESFVCIGKVFDSATNEFKGDHAWVKFKLNGKWMICETTIHDPKIGNIKDLPVAYGGQMKMRLEEIGFYDDREFRGKLIGA